MKKYAVLIDAENISYKLLGDIVAQVKIFGDASIRRIYGNFDHQRMKQWKIAATAYDFHPTQPFSFTGKQFADFALTIDAMDILHGDECPDGFVIVSSDSDLTGLVQRLRTSKKHVIGIGSQSNSSEQLKTACDEYILVENINSAAPVHTVTTSRQLQLMTKAIQKCVADDDGFVDLTHVGIQLRLLTPGGIGGKLSDHFIGHPDLFQIKRIGSIISVALVTEAWQLKLMTKAMHNYVTDREDGFVELGCVGTQLNLLTPGVLVVSYPIILSVILTYLKYKQI